MTQSPEYPDLKWVPPKSWTNANRGSVQLIIVHDTEGSEHASSAEDGAAYDQRRTDGTSTHYFHDTDSTVQCVRTEDIAHAARSQGNRRGIQHELCGKAGQGKSGWADAGSQSELRIAARQVARDCKKWGIPVRHLTVTQVADGAKGICGHWDVTRAFPQDGGTHTDPGPDFPWSQFLDLVRAELAGKTTTQEDDVAFADEKIKVTGTTGKELFEPDLKAGAEVDAGTLLQLAAIWARRGAADAAATDAKIDQVILAVSQLAGRDFTNEAEIVAGVLAGLDPQAIAAAIPTDLAQQVADELHARLAA